MVILCFFVSVPLRQQRVGLDIAGIARNLAVAAAAEAGAAAVLYSHTAEGAVAQRKLSAVLRRDNGEPRILVVDGQFRVFAVHRHIEASVAARDRQRNALGDEVHTIDRFPAGRQRHRPAGQFIGGPLPVDRVIHILIQRDGLCTVRRVRRLDGSGKGRVPARCAADGQRRRHLLAADAASALAVLAAVVRMRHDLDIFQRIHAIIGHSLIITCSVIRRALRQQVGEFAVAVGFDHRKCAAGKLDFGGVKIREDKRAAGDRPRDIVVKLNAAIFLFIIKAAAADVRDAAAVEFDRTIEGTALGIQRTVHRDGGGGECDARLHRRRAVDGRTFIAAAGKGHIRVFSDRHIAGGVRSALQRQHAGQRYGGAVRHIPQQGQRRLGAALIAPAVQGLDGLYIAVFQRTVFREVGSLGRAVSGLGGNFRVQFLVAHRAHRLCNCIIVTLMDTLRELHLVRCIAGQVCNFGALINDAPCAVLFAVQLALRVVGSQQVFNGEALALIVIRELADGAGVCIALPQLQAVARTCGAIRSIA